MKKIVFLGNPNVGKSALINTISKSKIKVGNWPGVTVEMITANYKDQDQEFHLIDLPGTYHLDGIDNEERITANYLLNEDYDLIVNVVDATNLERNLYLTLLARELQKPMIVLLNFSDEIEKQGLVIDINKLQKYLQVPVIKTSATKNIGIVDVKKYFVDFNKNDFKSYNIYFDTDIDNAILDIYEDIKDIENFESYDCYRLFEKNEKTLDKYDYHQKINVILAKHSIDESISTYNALQIKRYAQIQGLLHTIIDTKGVSRYEMTKKIDNILLNKYLGLPIFVVFILWFLSVIFNGTAPLIDWVDGFVNGFIRDYLQLAISNTPEWFQAMILDGILAGIGGVVVFVPLMYFIYLLMAILEESGYMSRIAFLMDRSMKGLGLSGKSFISMVLGFGCTVPAILSTRTLESEKAKKATALMVPFMSCGARLPVYALFTAAFFNQNAAFVIGSLYLLGILVAIIVGFVLNKLNIFVDDNSTMVMELPPYRFPELKLLFKNVNNKVSGFLKRICTTIMVVLFLMWGLSYLPNGNPKDSYLSKATEIIQPVFIPTGFGESKEAIAAIPSAIVAKEAIVGFLSQYMEFEEPEEKPELNFTTDLTNQVIGLKDAIIESAKSFVSLNIASMFDADASEMEEGGLVKATSQIFTGEDATLKAYSYMVYVLLLVPCIVTLATIKKEFSNKFMWQIVGVTLVVPYVASVLIYQIGSLIL